MNAQRIESADAVRSIKSVLAAFPIEAALQAYVAAARQFRYANRRDLIRRLAAQLLMDGTRAPRNAGGPSSPNTIDVIECLIADLRRLTQPAGSRAASDIGEVRS